MEPLQAKLAGGGEQLEYFEQLAGETMALTSGVEAGQVVLPQLLSGWKYYQKCQVGLDTLDPIELFS